MHGNLGFPTGTSVEALMVTSDVKPKQYKYGDIILGYRLLSVLDCSELSETTMRNISETSNPIEVVDDILALAEKVTIDGNIDDLPFEALHDYAQTIIAESGYNDDEESAKKFQEIYLACDKELNEPIHRIITLISDVYPTLSITEIEQWPIDKVILYFTRAKFILLGLRGIDPELLNEILSGTYSEDNENPQTTRRTPQNDVELREILNSQELSNEDKDTILREYLERKSGI